MLVQCMRPHFVVCGLFFGIGLDLVVQLIVLPLSGLHSTGPLPIRGLIQSLLVHMFPIGLPIACSERRFSKLPHRPWAPQVWNLRPDIPRTQVPSPVTPFTAPVKPVRLARNCWTFAPKIRTVFIKLPHSPIEFACPFYRPFIKPG